MAKNLMDMTLDEIDADPELQQQAAAVLLPAVKDMAREIHADTE